MTSKKHSAKTKFKLLLSLILACFLSFTMLFISACSTESSKIPEYTYNESDEVAEGFYQLNNASFAYGTVGVKLESFPKTTLTGWTLSKATSASKSGAIDVTDAGWKAVMSSLYHDSSFLNYVKEAKGFTNDDVVQAIKTQNNTTKTPSSTEIKDYIVEKYLLGDDKAFVNPGTHKDDVDSKVYMLNNYKTGEIGYGAVQSLSSATAITLNKGEYAKISVWVKTENLNTAITDSAYGEAIGANIKITNSFNGKTQASFGIYNIINTTWTEYTFFVKADEVYDTSFNIILGLGYDDDRAYAAEGTVYFDDITVEQITADEFKTLNPTVVPYNFTLNGEDNIIVKANSIVDTPLYDMSINVHEDLTGYVKDLTVNAYSEHFYTVSNSEGLNGKPFASSSAIVTNQTLTNEKLPYGINDAIKVDVNNASYTIRLNSADFKIGSESYAYVSFYIKNNLSKFFATDITIDVFDVNGTAKEKRPAVATFSESSDEWVQCSLLIYNNFDKDLFNTERSFYIEIVVGPAVVTSENIIDYASGSVYITSPILAKGASYQYANEEEKIETDNYGYYQLLSGSVSASTALYAGNKNDYVADETDSSIYSITVAQSDVGTIITKPATPKLYDGITNDHYYIDPESTNYVVDTKETAGLINTKYLSNYTMLPDLSSKLNHTGTDNIQPIVIYNASDDSYGYIGASNTISASSYAKISVKVRVVDSASAYIYLVDTANPLKTVMTFDDFTVNTDGFNTIAGEQIIGAEKALFFKVTSDMMESDGWLTVEFYVATGATAKNFRVEVWNGDRNGTEKSTGYVFFNDIMISTASAFTEATRWQDAFAPDNTLYNQAFEDGNLLLYKRELTDAEKKFNSEVDSSKKITYSPKYVWAKNDSLIYAIYNTVDPVEVDPYASNTGSDDSSSSEESNIDPSAFWLSFSSILLGVALVLAIIMLLIKNTIRRRKANQSDAKSHFKVTSRTRNAEKSKPAKKEVEKDLADDIDEDGEDDIVEEVAPEAEQENAEDANADEQSLDQYVYGDVQDFGDDEEK